MARTRARAFSIKLRQFAGVGRHQEVGVDVWVQAPGCFCRQCVSMKAAHQGRRPRCLPPPWPLRLSRLAVPFSSHPAGFCTCGQLRLQAQRGHAGCRQASPRKPFQAHGPSPRRPALSRCSPAPLGAGHHTPANCAPRPGRRRQMPGLNCGDGFPRPSNSAAVKRSRTRVAIAGHREQQVDQRHHEGERHHRIELARQPSSAASRRTAGAEQGLVQASGEPF